MEVTQDMLENWFVYHAPKGDQVERYQRIRDAGKQLAESILAGEEKQRVKAGLVLNILLEQMLPESIEKSYALDRFQDLRDLILAGDTAINCLNVLRFQILMPANAAIACNE